MQDGGHGLLKEDNIWRKKKQISRRRFFVLRENGPPPPQFQCWVDHHPSSSPRGQKFGETALALRATPTLKLGGGGSATPQLHHWTCRSSPNTSVQSFSPNFVLLPYLDIHGVRLAPRMTAQQDRQRHSSLQPASTLPYSNYIP